MKEVQDHGMENVLLLCLPGSHGCQISPWNIACRLHVHIQDTLFTCIGKSEGISAKAHAQKYIDLH